jgi:hypothetical protein
MEESVSDQSTSAKELNATIDRVNDATKLGIPRVSSDFGDTQVSLKAQLSPEQISKIAKLKATTIQGISSSDLSRAKKDELLQTIDQMNAAAGNESEPAKKEIARAKVLAEKIKADPGGWMGILKQVPTLGFEPQLSASSAAYTDPVKRAAELTGGQPERPSGSVPQPARAAEKLEAVNQTRKQIDDGLVRLMRDPFLSWDQKNEQAARLIESREKLEATADMRGVDTASRGAMLGATLRGGATRDPDGRQMLQVELVRSTPPEQVPELMRAAGLTTDLALRQAPRDLVHSLAQQALRHPDPQTAAALYRKATSGLGGDQDARAEVAYDVWRRMPDEQRKALPEPLRNEWAGLFERVSVGDLDSDAMDRLSAELRGVK